MGSLKGKLKEFEEKVATVNRIKNQIKDDNFNWSLLLQNEEPKIHLSWLILSIIFYFFVSGGILFFTQKGTDTYTFLFVIGVMSCIWLACCAHLRFKKVTVTTFVSLGSAIVFFVSAGIFTPEQAATDIKKMLGGKTDAVNNFEKKPIGIGSPIAERPSHTTRHTDRYLGDWADQAD